MDVYTTEQKTAMKHLPLACGFLGEMADISFIITLRMFLTLYNHLHFQCNNIIITDFVYEGKKRGK